MKASGAAPHRSRARSVVRRRLIGMARATSAPLGPVVGVSTVQPLVSLTFDDGPEPGGTDQVLEALSQRSSRATFFFLAARAQRHRALVDEVVRQGHEVGLHGLDHSPLTSHSPGEVRRRCLLAKAQLEDVASTPVRWLRPPYGRQLPWTVLAARAAGLDTVLWGPTTWDWRVLSQEARVEKSLVGAAPGAIVLCHDGFADSTDAALPAERPEVDRRDLVARVLRAYTDRGLRSVSLSTLVESGRPVREGRFSH